jgi:hypothetical protein
LSTQNWRAECLAFEVTIALSLALSVLTCQSMSDHHIQMWMLVVQATAFLGLIWYCVETRKMRKASQRQVEVSQGLISAAMEQVEGLSKPCLTLASELRDLRDVILETNRAVGTTQAASDSGNFMVQNIGNGIALNISYQFVKDSPGGETQQNRTRYIQNLLASQRVTIPESKSLFRESWTVIFEYESIGGRKYRTTLHINNHVLTTFRFELIAP